MSVKTVKKPVRVSSLAIVWNPPKKCHVVRGSDPELKELHEWNFRLYQPPQNIVPDVWRFLETYAGNLNNFERAIGMDPPSIETDYFPNWRTIRDYISRKRGKF